MANNGQWEFYAKLCQLILPTHHSTVLNFSVFVARCYSCFTLHSVQHCGVCLCRSLLFIARHWSLVLPTHHSIVFNTVECVFIALCSSSPIAALAHSSLHSVLQYFFHCPSLFHCLLRPLFFSIAFHRSVVFLSVVYSRQNH